MLLAAGQRRVTVTAVMHRRQTLEIYTR